MTKELYRNNARAEQSDKELEELEEQYRLENDPEYKASKENDKEDNPEPTNEEEKVWQKRYSDLRSFSAKEKNDLLKRIESLEGKVKEAETTAMPQDEADLEDWVTKYPDIARIVSTLIDKRTGVLKEDVTNVRHELELEREELAFQKNVAKILKAHPDFNELVQTSEYSEWLNRQPEEKGSFGQAIYDALVVNRTDPTAAIKAFDLFKAERKKRPAAQKEREENAATSVSKTAATTVPQSDGKKIWKESEIDRMDIRTYTRIEEELEAARLEGRIEYDISGAAR